MILLCRRAFALSIENRIDVSCDFGWDFGVRVLIEKTRNAWKLKEHTERDANIERHTQHTDGLGLEGGSESGKRSVRNAGDGNV